MHYTRCVGNSRLVLAVSVAFAAPALELFGEDSGGFHFIGLSSTGKTTTLRVAASVCGGGERGYMRTWRTTSNALEIAAEAHSDALLCLDELAELNPREAATVVYELGNGQGKMRMTAEGGPRRGYSWRLLYLSSGEISLADHAGKAADKIRGGQAVRFIEIPADAGCEMGLFEDIHDAPSPAEFAKTLAEAAATYYGAPLRAFVEELAMDREVAMEVIRTFREKALDVLPESDSEEVNRVRSRFAFVAAVGECATVYGLTGWDEGKSTIAALACYEAWLESRGSGSYDAQAGIRAVRRYLEEYGDSRFGTRAFPRAGFRTSENGVPHFCFLKEHFRQQVCGELDHLVVLKALEARALLLHEAKRQDIKRRFNGVSHRVYAVSSKILEELD